MLMFTKKIIRWMKYQVDGWRTWPRTQTLTIRFLYFHHTSLSHPPSSSSVHYIHTLSFTFSPLHQHSTIPFFALSLYISNTLLFLFHTKSSYLPLLLTIDHQSFQGGRKIKERKKRCIVVIIIIIE